MKRMRREKKESDQRKKLVIKKEFGKDKRKTGLKKRNKQKIEKVRKKDAFMKLTSLLITFLLIGMKLTCMPGSGPDSQWKCQVLKVLLWKRNA